MSPDTVVFKNCGLTYGDVVDVAARANNISHAAKLLGINREHLSCKVGELGIKHLFSDRRPRPSKVSKSEVVELGQQGFIRADIASMLEISESRLHVLINEWGIADKFTVRKGKAAWVRRRGYVGG